MLLTVTEQNLHTLKLDEALAVIWSNSFILQLRTLKLMEESNCYNMIDWLPYLTGLDPKDMPLLFHIISWKWYKTKIAIEGLL